MNKGRLISSVLELDALTEDEIELVKKMRELKEELLHTWDENSEKLGLNVERVNLAIKDDMGSFVEWKTYISKTGARWLVRGLSKSEYEIKKVST